MSIPFINGISQELGTYDHQVHSYYVLASCDEVVSLPTHGIFHAEHDEPWDFGWTHLVGWIYRKPWFLPVEKKGVSGKSSSSIHPILVGDKSPLLEVYFASETMIFVGHPPFWEASNGDFTSKFWRILKPWNLPMSISTIKWRRIKIQGSGICLVWNGCTVHNSWLPTRQFWIPHS